MDLDYFINKFEAIPKDLWTTHIFIDRVGRCCVLGHLGVRYSKETGGPEERMLLQLAPLIDWVNDNYGNKFIKFGDNPKDRVINYLKSLK